MSSAKSIPMTPSELHPPVCQPPRLLWDAGTQLGEGLCWSPRDEAIYWVDILGRSLMRLHVESGERRTWHFEETVSAVAERADAPGLVISLQRELAFFDPATDVLQRLGEVEPQHPGNRFNDGKCDAQGRFWACSMDFGCTEPTGSLYRMEMVQGEPRVSCAWAAGFPVVNGPAWSRDGRTLWLNDTARNRIHALDFDPAGGEVSNPRVWLRLSREDGLPDGMTTDADGRLWIAHWGGSCVTCHAPGDGRELARIALPALNVTNVCFGGPDMRTLFVSTASTDLTPQQKAEQPHAGALFAVETNATGVPPHRFAG